MAKNEKKKKKSEKKEEKIIKKPESEKGQSGKKLYFYPKYKTTGTSPEDARKRLEGQLNK